VSLLFYFGRTARARRRGMKLPLHRIADAPEGQLIKVRGRLELLQLVFDMTSDPLIIFDEGR
jgi:hypothetical protein